MFYTNDDGQYNTLSDIADAIFSRCDDNPSCIAAEIHDLDPETRSSLLSSDLLNAWQVFWYYFEEYPGDEAVEFLTFHSAGDLKKGVPMGDIDVFTLSFQVIDGVPEVGLSDDLQEVARFRGAAAWAETRSFIDGGV